MLFSLTVSVSFETHGIKAGELHKMKFETAVEI